MPTTSHLYGQPDDEYEVFLPFAETLVKTSHRSGYKLHVTVTTQHHETHSSTCVRRSKRQDSTRDRTRRLTLRQPET